MAGRIRTIKPEMLEDERTAGLSHAAFRLWVGMILLADDVGRLRADPRYLLGHVFWCAPECANSTSAREDVSRARAEIEQAQLVILYRVRGQEYASIRSWRKHQKIDRPSPAKCPGPEESDCDNTPKEQSNSPVATPTPSDNESQFDEDSTRARCGIGSGREGKGEELLQKGERVAVAPTSIPNEPPKPAEGLLKLSDGTDALGAFGILERASNGGFSSRAGNDFQRRLMHILIEHDATKEDLVALGQVIAQRPDWVRITGVWTIPVLLGKSDDTGKREGAMITQLFAEVENRRKAAKARAVLSEVPKITRMDPEESARIQAAHAARKKAARE